MIRLGILIALFLATPDIAGLVKKALGQDVAPYEAVRPVIADFDGDGQQDLAVVVDFNKKLQGWLKRGVVIHNLDSPSLAPMHPDTEQHFCFGVLILEGMQPDRKTILYGCFTGWHLIRGTKASLDLDMESGDTLRLYNDGSHASERLSRTPHDTLPVIVRAGAPPGTSKTSVFRGKHRNRNYRTIGAAAAAGIFWT